jgi:hypothetical protein
MGGVSLQPQRQPAGRNALSRASNASMSSVRSAVGRLFGRSSDANAVRIGPIRAFESVDGGGSERGEDDFVADDSQAGSQEEEDDETEDGSSAAAQRQRRRSVPQGGSAVPAPVSVDPRSASLVHGTAHTVITVASAASPASVPHPSPSSDANSLSFALSAAPRVSPTNDGDSLSFALSAPPDASPAVGDNH